MELLLDWLEALRSLGLYLWKRWSSLSKIWVRRICGKEHNRAPLDQLSDDIWNSIFQRLPLVDRVHASPVRKQWFSTLRQTPADQPVWLLLPPDEECGPGEIKFLDFCDGTFDKLKLPYGAIAVGTCKGWFIVIVSGIISWEISLLDPISRVQLALPPLSSIPSTFWNNAFISETMDMSSRETSQAVVAACFDKRNLALCRPKDKRWTVFKGLGSAAQKYLYFTIRFCDRILYALVTPEDGPKTMLFNFKPVP